MPVPAGVHDVLRATSGSLPAHVRTPLEAAFQHDFSGVRVHTDPAAVTSAESIGARAYTVGGHVVMRPGDASDRRLVAHELAHVVQQRGRAGPPTHLSAPGDVDERAADAASAAVAEGRPVPAIRPASGTGPSVMRTLLVDRAPAPVPTPSPAGQATPTRAETVEGYLRTIAPDAGVSVDRTSGEVEIKGGFCPGLGVGISDGATAGFRGVRDFFGPVPLLGTLFGLVGGLIGGIVGGIRSLVSEPEVKRSTTPTGSGCLCDMVHAGRTWHVDVDDRAWPSTVTGRVTVPGPNAAVQPGSAAVSGRRSPDPPWLLLAHELCGHAWLEQKDIQEQDYGDIPAHLQNMPAFTGRLGNEAVLRHGRTVERENLIRAEHGIEARGFRVKDPYCGESFAFDRDHPDRDPQSPADAGVPGLKTRLEQCQAARDALPESQTRKFRIDERIP